MDKQHRNELAVLSQEMYDSAADRITNYLADRYCAVGNDTMEQQMEDYLFLAEETGAFLLGNALALLDPESREAEIRAFTDSVRRVTAMQLKKADRETPPS